MIERITIRLLKPAKVKVNVTSVAHAVIKIRGRIITTAASAAIKSETPSGSLDGSNATFQSAFEFIPASVEAFVNGLKQKPVDHYTTSGNRTINFADSPQSADLLLINYEKP